MISFLNPWLWLGLAAVGAPIWLHLRRRDREEIIRFSALRFLEDQPVARQAPLELRNLLLFLLRVLAILLIVAAFCRPYFPAQSDSVSSSEVYILDNTLSRQADQGLEHDRRIVIDRIRSAGPHEQIAVVEVAYQPKVITGFGDNSALAEGKLNALQPGTQRGSMLSALRQADFLLKQSIGENKHITILSDEQENQWSENSNTPPFLTPGLVSIGSGSSVPNRPNFYVTGPKLQRIFIGNIALVQFTAQIGHSGATDTGVITLASNGREIVRQKIALDPKTKETTLVAKWDTDPSVWLHGSLSVEAPNDALPQDNVAYFNFPPVTEGRVAILSESVYLQTALSSSVARGYWKAERLQPAELAGVLSAPPEKDADVLMVDANYLQSNLGRSLVNRYLQGGRGVFIMVGRLSTLLTGYLKELGFEPRLGADTGGTSPALQPIRYFNAESPVFRPFIIPDFSNLLEVRIGEGVHLESKIRKPLLFSQNGNGLLFDGTRDKGHFLLSTFTFDRDQTDWVVHPSFVPFLDSALEYLRPQPSLSGMMEPGEIWSALIPSDQNAKTVILHDGDKEAGRAEVTPEHRANLRVPDQPGAYTLTYDAEPAVRQMLAVNPSSLESELRYLQVDPPMLKAWTLSETAGSPSHPAAAMSLPSFAKATQQILWWKLLLAGLAALFLEMVVLARRRSPA